MPHEKNEKLVQRVCGLPDGSEDADEDGTDGYQDGSEQGVSGKRFTQNQRREYGIEDEARLERTVTSTTVRKHGTTWDLQPGASRGRAAGG